MAKTLQDYFGLYSWHSNGQLEINFPGMGQSLGLSYEEIPENPTPEELAATLLMVMNLGTRPETDANGFVVQDDTQAIVSPSSEPRRVFVNRNGEKQIKTTVTFDIYTRDTSSFNPSQVVKNNEDNPQESQA